MVDVVLARKGIIFVFSNGVVNDKGYVVSSNNGLIFSYNKVIGRPIKTMAIELVDKFLNMRVHKWCFLYRVGLNDVVIDIVNVEMLFKEGVGNGLRWIDFELGRASMVINESDNIVRDCRFCRRVT